MLKPWLLMTADERAERKNLYLACITSSAPIDEALLVSVKPPETRLQALLELYMYQLRGGKGRRGSVR